MFDLELKPVHFQLGRTRSRTLLIKRIFLQLVFLGYQSKCSLQPMLQREVGLHLSISLRIL